MRFLRRLLDHLRGPGYRCQDCSHWFNYSHVCGDRDQHVHIWPGRSRYAQGGIIHLGPRVGDLYQIDNGHIVPNRRRAKPTGDLS